MNEREAAVVLSGVIFIIGAVVFGVLDSNAANARNAECQTIGYQRGFSAGGKDYCVREIVSPRDNREGR